ncbi:MAG TPA: TolC family protein [Gammaproteobacteria bacterium]
MTLRMIVTRPLQPLFVAAFAAAVATLATPVGGALAQAADTDDVLRIDLPSALRLADERNLDVAIYVERVAEATAKLTQARMLAVPAVRVGASTNRHDGTLQETSGNIVDADRVARFSGLGAGAVGAGDVSVPGLSMSVDVADAIFQPLVARQNRAAVVASSVANRHAVLIDVAGAYLEWIRARSERDVVVEALARATELATLTASYAEAGEGLRADAEMAAVQPLLWEQRRAATDERIEAAAAELSRLLHLDSGVALEPVERDVPSIEIFDGNESPAELVAQAVDGRPETEQLDALVAAAEDDLTAQRYGWFIPSVALGYSSGQFGGGPGSAVANTDHRDDLSLLLYWQFDAFGIGNRARIDEKRARLRQTSLERDKLRDTIAAEVRHGYARVQSLRQQRSLTGPAAASARSAYELHRDRIYDQQGLPLEALQAMQTLAAAELAQVDVEAAYSLAQLRLHTAIGNPIDLAE